MKPGGYEIWRGPSPFDGSPVVSIVTGFKASKNPKTGNMLQQWTIPLESSPSAAMRCGSDGSVCGDCPFRRGKHGRGCYVNPLGPDGVFKAFKAGSYPVAKLAELPALVAGRSIRFGAFGEPVCMPIRYAHALMKRARGCTGYTHAAHNGRFRGWKRYLMASSHNSRDAAGLRSRGWRTFRVTSPGEPLDSGEFWCPGPVTGTTCAECMLCGGTDSATPRSVANPIHGTVGAVRAFSRLVASGELRHSAL